MFYLHVFDENEQSNSIVLENAMQYIIANDFNGDIFIDCFNNEKYESMFIIKNNNINFLKSTHDLKFNDQSLIMFDKFYPLPVEIIVDNKKISINNNQYPKLHVEDFFDFKKNAVLYDESVSVNIPTIDDSNDVINKIQTTNPNNRTIFYKFIDKIKLQFKQLINQVKKNAFIIQLLAFITPYYIKFKNKLGVWIYAFWGLCIIIGLCILFLVFQLFATNNDLQIQEDNMQTKNTLKQVFLQLPQKFVNLKMNAEGNKFIIQGMVANKTQLNELASYFRAYKASIKINVISFLDVEPMLLQILNSASIQNLHVKFDDSTGSVLILGMVDNADKLEDTEIVISNKLPQIGYVDTSRVFRMKDINDDINKIFNNKYDQRLNLEKNFDKGQVIVNGYLSNAETTMLAKDVETFNNKYKDVIQIKLNIKDVSLALPFAIIEVHTTPPAWIVTQDGVRTFVGGSYNNFTLVSIDDGKITLKGDFTVSIQINELTSIKKNYSESILLNKKN